VRAAVFFRPWARSPFDERKMNSCVWCERQFNPRRSGGRSQRFCRPSCRRAFHAAARTWVLRAIARGALTIPDLRTDAIATRTLLLGTISRALVLGHLGRFRHLTGLRTMPPTLTAAIPPALDSGTSQQPLPTLPDPMLSTTNRMVRIHTRSTLAGSETFDGSC
jgi:hypothetical protein